MEDDVIRESVDKFWPIVEVDCRRSSHKVEDLLTAVSVCLDEFFGGIWFPRTPNATPSNIAVRTIQITTVKLNNELLVSSFAEPFFTDLRKLVIASSTPVGLTLAKVTAI